MSELHPEQENIVIRPAHVEGESLAPSEAVDDEIEQDILAAFGKEMGKEESMLYLVPIDKDGRRTGFFIKQYKDRNRIKSLDDSVWAFEDSAAMAKLMDEVKIREFLVGKKERGWSAEERPPQSGN